MSFASIVGSRSSVALRPEVRYVAIGALIVIALLLVGRRLAGALVVPLAPATALACGLTLAALVAVTDYASLRRRALRYLPFAAAGAACLALSLRGTAVLSLLLLWEPLVIVEPLRRLLARRGDARPVTTSATARIRQQLTRSIEAGGRDVCRGTARAILGVGQRSTSIHVAFCPPFATLPTLEAEVSDASDAVVKIGLLLPYAARIDVKLPQPAAAAQEVAVSFAAWSDAVPSTS